MSQENEVEKTPEWAENIADCLKEYTRAYNAEAELKADHKKAKDHLNRVILYAKQLMEDEDIPSMVVANPDTGEKRNCYLHKITKCNVRAGKSNSDELFEALRLVGLENLIKDSVHAGSLDSALKEQFMDETECIVLPPELGELINVYEEFTVRSRKG